MKQKPNVLNIKTVAQSRLFNIEQLDLEFSNGVKTEYERIRGGKRGAVLVVPVKDENTLFLIREYAAGVDRYELGFPKGKIESGESIVDAANREMQEEIGYAAKKLRHVTTVTLAPGYIGHKTHIVIASDLYEKKRVGDEPEEIEVVPWSVSDLNNLLTQEDFTEARSIAALFLTINRLKEMFSD